MAKDEKKVRQGKRAKRKGWEGEHEVERLLIENNIPAQRIPLSGAVKKGNIYSGDIEFYINNNRKKGEVKRRKNGLISLYKWLEQDNADALFVRQDRKNWLVVLPIKEYLNLAKKKGE